MNKTQEQPHAGGTRSRWGLGVGGARGLLSEAPLPLCRTRQGRRVGEQDRDTETQRPVHGCQRRFRGCGWIHNDNNDNIAVITITEIEEEEEEELRFDWVNMQQQQQKDESSSGLMSQLFIPTMNCRAPPPHLPQPATSNN